MRFCPSLNDDLLRLKELENLQGNARSLAERQKFTNEELYAIRRSIAAEIAYRRSNISTVIGAFDPTTQEWKI